MRVQVLGWRAHSQNHICLNRLWPTISIPAISLADSFREVGNLKFLLIAEISGFINVSSLTKEFRNTLLAKKKMYVSGEWPWPADHQFRNADLDYCRLVCETSQKWDPGRSIYMGGWFEHQETLEWQAQVGGSSEAALGQEKDWTWEQGGCWKDEARDRRWPANTSQPNLGLAAVPQMSALWIQVVTSLAIRLHRGSIVQFLWLPGTWIAPAVHSDGIIHN